MLLYELYRCILGWWCTKLQNKWNQSKPFAPEPCAVPTRWAHLSDWSPRTVFVMHLRAWLWACCTPKVTNFCTVRAAAVVLAAEAVNTWLWFKVLQVDLILVFSDVLMPPHHHNRKLELRTNTHARTSLDSLPLFTCRTLNTVKIYSDWWVIWSSATLHVEQKQLFIVTRWTQYYA